MRVRSDHLAQLAGVDEERLILAVAALTIVAAPRQEPQAGGYLRGAEELAGQGDDAVHNVSLDQVLAYLTLAGLARRH